MMLLAELLPDQASNFAGPSDAMFFTLTAMTAVLTGGIAACILYFVVRYRRRDPNDTGQETAQPMALEIAWTVIPLVICLGLFGWAAELYVRMSQPPADAMVIEVIGKQWMWKVQHPSGRKEINELHVPLGRAIRLEMTSQDVIHAFYVPAFRIKQDVVPGRYSQQWFVPTKLGEYHLFCTEYCGTSHALMGGRVVVMSPGDYELWAANAALDERPEAAGGRLFAQYGCMACHGQQAPTLAGIFGHEQVMQDGERVRVDENYVRESILQPRARIVAGYPPIMPSFAGQLSEEQLFQLLAYIKSLQTPASPLPPVNPTPARPTEVRP
ncbi:MAG TPA: cytochrome c oxidase subunit II [Phycisphaerae bacterium]|nr:cytochrome c oxidase subunit II [Phycisphaerae bacterium]